MSFLTRWYYRNPRSDLLIPRCALVMHLTVAKPASSKKVTAECFANAKHERE